MGMGEATKLPFSLFTTGHLRPRDQFEAWHESISVIFDVAPPADALFSTATFHWVLDQESLPDHLAAVIRPAGQLVAQCGGVGNNAVVFGALEAEVAEGLRRGNLAQGHPDPGRPGQRVQPGPAQRHQIRIRQAPRHQDRSPAGVQLGRAHRADGDAGGAAAAPRCLRGDRLLGRHRGGDPRRQAHRQGASRDQWRRVIVSSSPAEAPS